MKRYPRVDLVYLFGSSAKGRSPARDADIAVLLRPAPPRGLAELRLRARLEEDMKAFADAPVDLVILNSAPVALRQQVLKYGRLLFERRAGAAKKFFMATVTEYFDYLQLLNFFAERLPGRRRAL